MEWAQRRTWRVVIPFADALMALLSQLPPAERDYRDAANLLRLIAASAIWHLQHRQHAITDESVTVIADLADYALVRQLVAPTFAKTRAFALSEGERQIVDALRLSDAPMTVKEIAQATNLSPTAVRCRLNRLKAKEIVADEQSPERREKVWRVVASATFLSDLLPTPDQVRAHWRPDPTDPPQKISRPTCRQPRKVVAFMRSQAFMTRERLKTLSRIGIFAQAFMRSRKSIEVKIRHLLRRTILTIPTQPTNPNPNVSRVKHCPRRRMFVKMANARTHRPKR
jgi:hypothetical protein